MQRKIKVNLRKIRDEKGLKQWEICERAGIKVRTKLVSGEYGYIEKGKRIPRVDKAIRIARALGVSVEEVWEIK